MSDGDGADCFVCTHCTRTFADRKGLNIHLGMIHKKKVITTGGVKRPRRVESPAPGEFEGGDATRGPSEGVLCVEEHDAVHDRAHDEEHDEMLTEILSSLVVDESDGLQNFVGRSSVGACLNVFPSWDALDQAAVDLARNGPVPPVDLVATGQFTREEAAFTAWGQCTRFNWLR